MAGNHSTAMGGRVSVNRPADQTPEQGWQPVLAGQLPPLDESFSARPETGFGLTTGLPAGEVVVLTHPDQATDQPLAALGGTGKTQLALASARSLWQSGEVELLAWVTGSSRDAILTGYTQGLRAVHAATGEAESAEATAARFLSWLAGTGRSWLVVIDDVTDLADLEGLWPWGPAGRVLVTTRLPAQALTGPNRQVLQVPEFSPREAVSYLTARLIRDPDQRIGVLDLAAELGCLPAALAQAASVIADCDIHCRQYLQSFTDRRQQMAGEATDRLATISATWTLSLDRADYLTQGDLAWPTLAFIALLGGDGIPAAVLTSQAASEYLCGGRVTGQAAQTRVQATLDNLARAGLITLGTDGEPPTVRLHSLTRAAIRQVIPGALAEQAAGVAADALVQAWPDGNLPPLTAQAMRACATALQRSAGELLWSPQPHPLLIRAGESLDRARLTGPAVSYWRAMTDTSARLLGPGHARTLEASDHFAAALAAAGRPADAIALYQHGLTERSRLLGWDHADALTARARLAAACLAADRQAEAVSLYESTLAGREQALGLDHPDTLASRAELAAAYRAAGRLGDAIDLFKRAVYDREAALGRGHSHTVAARAELAAALQAAGQVTDAIPLWAQVLHDRERTQGVNDLDAVAARASLAYAYRLAGRLKDALPLYKRTLADRERLLGADHPDTLAARGNLASAYHTARKFKDAIALYEQTVAGRERTQGDDHPDTLVARGNLASAYHSAGRMVLAVPLYEKTLADYVRVKGPDHPDTLTSRANLASAYHTVGRLTDTIATLQRTLADCEHTLPSDHPLTQAIRENLAAVSSDLRHVPPVEDSRRRRQRGVAQDQVGRLLRDHHHRRVDVAVRDVGHHRRVDDPQPVQAVHPHRAWVGH